MSIRIPQYGQIVSSIFCAMSSNPEKNNAPTLTVWERSWASPAKLAVTGKTYLFNGTNITGINLAARPITKSDDTQAEQIEFKTGTTILTVTEMLISIDTYDKILANNRTYTCYGKDFYRNGDGWFCNLIGVNDQQSDIVIVIRRDSIDHNTMIHAARAHDRIMTSDNNRQLIKKKTFKESNDFQVTIETIGNGENTYTTTKNIDFNNVFLTSSRGNIIEINNTKHVVESKLCVVTRSNEDYVTPYILLN